MLVRQEQFSSPTLTYGDTLLLFFKTAKAFMFCFTGNICHRLSLMLYELKYDSDVLVNVVKKITNVL
jgi:hypothetical protein